MNMKSIAVSLCSLASLAFAKESACDYPKNSFDGLYCLSKVYMQADKDLNEVYGKLAKKFDPSDRKSLKSGQMQWIQERNDNCSELNARGFFVDMDCATRTTVDRVRFLEDRLRECASTGCQPSKL